MSVFLGTAVCGTTRDGRSGWVVAAIKGKHASGAICEVLTGPAALAGPRRGDAGDGIASVLAELWDAHGAAAPCNLDGEHAFAVHDRRSESLVLVRDHVGARSLYWARHGSDITFGSDIDHVLAQSGLPRSIDERAVAGYLAQPNRPLTGTFFEGVHTVPPGSLVEFTTAGDVRTRRWWAPSTGVSVRLPRAADYAAAARELVERAVGARVAGLDRVGAHVSGGIDSTGIAVLAANQLRTHGGTLTGLYTWSPAISEDYPAIGGGDERRRVLSIASDVPVRFGRAEEQGLLAFLERPMELEGTADLADEIPMLRLAAQDGVQVMLSGWGGDEAFSAHGFGHLAYLLTRGRLRASATFARSILRTLRRPRPLIGLLWSGALHPLLPERLYQGLASTQAFYQNYSFLAPDLRRRHRDELDARRARMRYRPHSSANIWEHLSYGHIAMRMETWAAWSRPLGFEYRYPLTDRRLLEFLMAIPPEALLMNDEPRGLARAAFADVLPADASKNDPVNEWLRRNTRERAWRRIAERTRSGAWLREDCPWLDMPALRASATTPKLQDEARHVLEFAELFAALRIWFLYRRCSSGTAISAPVL